MLNNKTIVSLSLVLAATTTASANPGYELGQVARWVLETRNEYGGYGIRISQCTAAIAEMRTGKIATYSTPELGKFGAVKDPDGSNWTISLPDAEKLCKEAELMLAVIKDYNDLSRMAREQHFLDDTSLGPNWASGALENANACVKSADELLAIVPATFKYVIKDHEQKQITQTVEDIKPKLCEETRKRAQKYIKTLDDETKAYDAKLKKAGITGEKAEWFKHYNGNMFTAGGREPELAGYGKASVWFAYTYSSDPDITGNHLFSVRRYQFKGNKLVKSSEKTYRRPLSFKNSIGSVMK